jgi:glutathione S-transferase
MPKLKLIYFDIDGGRGEPIRLALRHGGIDFEDYRFPFSEWPSLRESTPFRAVPVLEVDGVPLSQSNTILRYAGALAGLYPKDPWTAARCDEVMDAVEDAMHEMSPSFRLHGEEQKAAREKLVAGPLPFYLERVAALLIRGGGEYFVESRLTIADLKVFAWTKHLKGGVLDHVPSDIVARHAPALDQHCERVRGESSIAAYYQTRQ